MFSSEDYDLSNGVASGPARIKYPLQSEGDTTAVLVEQDYYIKAVSYKAPVLNTTLSTGGDLKKPFNSTVPIPTCYRVDDLRRGVTNGVLLFVKRWASIPASRTDVFEGSYSFPFPSYQVGVITIPANADAADDDNNLYRWESLRSANSMPAPLYVDYTYFLKDSPPTFPTVFRPTLDGNAVDFVSDGVSLNFTNATALDGSSFSAAVSVSATVPSLTTYQSYITGDEDLTVDVQVDRYLGDIFEMRTLKMKAK